MKKWIRKILCKLGRHKFKIFAESAMVCIFPNQKGFTNDSGFLHVCVYCGQLKMESKYSGVILFTEQTAEMMSKNMNTRGYMQ